MAVAACRLASLLAICFFMALTMVAEYQSLRQILPPSWDVAGCDTAGSPVVDLYGAPPFDPTADYRIHFLHLGKAGGESLKSVLKAGCMARMNAQRRTQCLASLPASEVGGRTVAYTHVFKTQRFDGNGTAAANAFLLNLRHPADRFESWYYFVHPDFCRERGRSSVNCMLQERIRRRQSKFGQLFFQVCFPTLSHLTDLLQQPAEEFDGKGQICRDLAAQAFAGDFNYDEPEATLHLEANYREMARLVLAEAAAAAAAPHMRDMPRPLFVVRTETLWDDLRALDRRLGGNGDFGERDGFTFTHGSERVARPALDAPALTALCCGLRAEMEAYRGLLERAANLPVAEKAETVQAAVEHCGFQTWLEFAASC